MKRVAFTTLVLAVLALTGADIRRETPQPAPGVVKQRCSGYTIVEFGKGIDCNGDTLTLVKVDGGQALFRKQKVAS